MIDRDTMYGMWSSEMEWTLDGRTSTALLTGHGNAFVTKDIDGAPLEYTSFRNFWKCWNDENYTHLEQPGWMIVYEDSCMGTEIFTEEKVARKRLCNLADTWNVHLFKRVASR